MTLQSISPFGLWLSEFGPQTSALNSMLVDAAGEKAGYVFSVPKTGNIDKVGVRTMAVTTGETMPITLEGLDANGDPSGTLWSAGSSASRVLVAGTDSNKFIEVTLGTPAPVVRGDRLAIVCAWASPGVVNLTRVGAVAIQTGIPYCDLFTGSWAKLAGFCAAVIHYDDGTYANIGGVIPLDTIALDAFQDSTNPDERGNKITIPFKCKVSGIWAQGASNLGDFTAKLYDASSTLLASKVCDGDAQIPANPKRILLDTEVTLNAGDVVIASLLATGVVNTQLLNYTCPAGMSAALPGAGKMVYTTRNNGGAWTDTSDKIAGLGLIVSALDDGLSGGAVETAHSFVM